MPERHSSSEAVIVACIVAALLLGLLVVAGAGLFVYTRTMSMQQAVAAREEALLAAKQAQLAQLRMATNDLGDKEPSVGNRPAAESSNTEADANALVTIRIDEDGSASMGGEPTDVDGLISELTSAGRSERIAIHVDPRCQFRHVARVLELCRQAGVESQLVSASQ